MNGLSEVEAEISCRYPIRNALDHLIEEFEERFAGQPSTGFADIQELLQSRQLSHGT
jgi:hypothetical protein